VPGLRSTDAAGMWKTGSLAASDCLVAPCSCWWVMLSLSLIGSDPFSMLISDAALAGGVDELLPP